MTTQTTSLGGTSQRNIVYCRRSLLAMCTIRSSSVQLRADDYPASRRRSEEHWWRDMRLIHLTSRQVIGEYSFDSPRFRHIPKMALHCGFPDNTIRKHRHHWTVGPPRVQLARGCPDRSGRRPHYHRPYSRMFFPLRKTTKIPVLLFQLASKLRCRTPTLQ